ncbi:MAG: FkbM family methyltransferase [Bacteroidota bacterium]
MSLKKVILDNVPPSLILRGLSLKHQFSGVPELKLLKKLIKPGTDSIDVGVYLGVFSINMAKYARKVYSFEPHPKHFEFSRKALPKNVEVMKMALSDRTFESELVVPLEYPSAGSISKGFEGRNVERFKVKAQPLDDFNYDNISCIKIDAEGHEFNIIKGAKKTIERNKPNLIIEIEQRHIDFDISEVFDGINEMGYKGYFFQDNKIHSISNFNTGKHQPLDQIGVYNVYINNFIFIPSDLELNLS